MNIIEVQALPNGAHRNQNDFSGDLPEGWAVIPDDMVIPDSFPFVGVEAEEKPYYREVWVTREVTKTREVESFDEEGNPIIVIEEYTEIEDVLEQEEYFMLTVTALIPGVLPEPVVEEREPTAEEVLNAMLGVE